MEYDIHAAQNREDDSVSFFLKTGKDGFFVLSGT